MRANGRRTWLGAPGPGARGRVAASQEVLPATFLLRAGHRELAEREFNEQTLDADGFRGRMLSSSYVPGPDHPERTAVLDALDVLFERHQVDGAVRIDYDTTVYYGQL